MLQFNLLTDEMSDRDRSAGTKNLHNFKKSLRIRTGTSSEN